MTDPKLTLTGIVAVVVPGVLVLASTLLPWATYENREFGTTIEYGAGSFGYVVALLAVASVACALLGAWYPAPLLQGVALAFAAGCLVSTLVLAFVTIVAANDAASSHTGASQTSRAAGAVLGVVGSVGMLIGCSLLRRSRLAAAT